MYSGTFNAYLKAAHDRCFKRDDFISQGPAALDYELVEFIGDDGTVGVWPEDVVFKEQPSTLVAADGTEVNEW